MLNKIKNVLYQDTLYFLGDNIFVNVLEKLIFTESFHLYSYWILLDTWK